MKTKLNLKIISIGVFTFMLILVGCKKEQKNGDNAGTSVCATVDCGPNGTCNQGICDCDEYYESNQGKCNVLEREKFLGTFDYDETCTSSTDSYEMSITKNDMFDSLHVIRFSKIWGQPNIQGKVYGDSIKIERQLIQPNTYIVGKGKLENNVITISAFISVEEFGNASTNCVFILTKK